MLHHGGGSLGWSGGAAVGAKLALAAERTVVSLVGEVVPVQRPVVGEWVQRRYAPALTVIYDNRGWAGPKFSTLMVYPAGAAARLMSSLCRGAEGGPARGRAGRGHGVRRNGDRSGRAQGIKDALAIVHAGRSAVVSVRLPRASQPG